MLRSYHHLLLFLIRGSLISDGIGLLSLIYSRVVYCTFMHSSALKKRGTLVCHYSNEQMLIREGCRGTLWGILNDVFGIGNVFWASRDHRRNPWIYAARRCHQNSESFVDLYYRDYYQFCTRPFGTQSFTRPCKLGPCFSGCMIWRRYHSRTMSPFNNFKLNDLVSCQNRL